MHASVGMFWSRQFTPRLREKTWYCSNIKLKLYEARNWLGVTLCTVCLPPWSVVSSIIIPPHRRRSSVSFTAARYFCPKNMHEELTKCPNFIWFLSEKLSKYPNFYDICPKSWRNSRILHDFRPKNAQILHNNCQKIIIYFRIFFLGGARSPCPSCLLHLCSIVTLNFDILTPKFDAFISAP